MRWTLKGCGLSFCLLLAAQDAAASPEDRKAADALFNEGLALAAKGKFAEACPKFAASQKLDPTPGAALTLADCLEKNGQRFAAWREFDRAAAFSRAVGDDARHTEAQRRAALLEPHLPKLVIELPPGSDFTVELDGNVVKTAALSKPIPIEPGSRTIVVSAPGRISYRKVFRAPTEPEIMSLRVPPLAKPAAPGSTGPDRETREAEAAIEAASQMKKRRTRHLAAGSVGIGLGAVGLGAGAILGAIAADTYRESNDGHCFPNNRCDQVGLDLRAEAPRYGNAATTAFIVGGVLLGAGIVVVATAPSAMAPLEPTVGYRSNIRMQITLVPGGLQARGEW